MKAKIRATAVLVAIAAAIIIPAELRSPIAYFFGITTFILGLGLIFKWATKEQWRSKI